MNPGNDWIDQARRVLDALRADTGNATSADGATPAGHSTDCRWCPVCQVAAVVRGERPELTAALADVLTATATALRTFAEAAHPDGPAGSGTPDGTSDFGTPDFGTPDDRTSGDAPEDRDAPGTTPLVQRIDIA